MIVFWSDIRFTFVRALLHNKYYVTQIIYFYYDSKEIKIALFLFCFLKGISIKDI